MWAEGRMEGKRPRGRKSFRVTVNDNKEIVILIQITIYKVLKM